MTVKVVGHWEFGWLVPRTEYDLWYHNMREFSVDEWCMVPITGINEAGIVERDTLQEYIDENPTLTVVYLDEDGDQPLEPYTHPTDVLYICGKSGFSPWKSAGSPAGALNIETPLASGLLWAHQAAAIVLYDRFRKA